MTYPNKKLKYFLVIQLFFIWLVPHDALGQTAPKTGDSGDWTTIISKSMPGVVSISMFDSKGASLGSGSGFIVQSDGVVVTNYHVIKGASIVRVTTKQGEKYEVRGVIAFDTIQDFAIIRIPAVDLPVVPLGNSNDVTLGEPVLAIGDPLGLVGSVSTGIVSSPARKDPQGQMEGTWIQTTTPISGGNSGGPLFNRRGQVIGMITWAKMYDGMKRPVQNLNFAVPINYVRGALQLGTTIQHTLVQLAQAEAAAEEEAFRKAFTLYEDPNGIFSLKRPSGWRVQRTSTPQSNGNTVIETIFAPQEASLAETGGYLSEGIRISVVLPPQGGYFSAESVEADKNRFGESALKANKGFELTNTGMFMFNDDSAKVYTLEGKSVRLPEAEKSVIYVFGNQKAIVLMEVVQPASKIGLVDVFNLYCAKTFELRANFTTPPGGPPSGPRPEPPPPAIDAVTPREIETAFKANLFDDVIQKANRFLQSNPNSPEANAYLGLALVMKKDADNGAIYLTKAISLGQQITLPFKRLKIPLIGHAFEEALITISATEVTISAGGSWFKTRLSGLSNSALFNYNNQCSIATLEGYFTETFQNSAKVKQDNKKFNLFPPNSGLTPVQDGKLVYNMAVCDVQTVHTTVLIKLLSNLMARTP